MGHVFEIDLPMTPNMHSATRLLLFGAARLSLRIMSRLDSGEDEDHDLAKPDAHVPLASRLPDFFKDDPIKALALLISGSAFLVATGEILPLVSTMLLSQKFRHTYTTMTVKVRARVAFAH